ncbi:response regulator [Luteolibacter luteus]|uniref:histidine kinase n=1 Tax=Luteolibacter luteus TaxID=2728835 RepID=A0A858RQZ6_9BACT|nr:response regulator [Luteolibacter luteus]QJE98769.1 response regulator [Luteolibacter luteus]
MPTNLRQSLPASRKGASNLPLYIGFAAALVFFILSGYNAFRNTVALREGARQVQRTHEVITSFDDVLSLVKDAETGQRGYVITGADEYLQPYHAARAGIGAGLEKMRELTKDSVLEKDLFIQVEAQIDAKLTEMEETIALRRDRGFDAARDVVATDRGKQTMDQLRDNLGAMEREEKRIRALRLEDMESAHRVALSSGLATAALGIVLSFAIMTLIRRAHILRKRQEWTQLGKLELTTAMAGEKGLQALAESALSFITRYVEAHAAAIFVRRKSDFDRLALNGVPLDGSVPERFEPGEGLLGRAVTERTLQRIDDVPAGYLKVGSGLGEGVPRHLLILPALADDNVNAVIELGFLHPLEPWKQEFLQQVSEPIGVAIKSSLYREHLQELLEETQSQSEELQAQSEELRVSNEELEEQSRALKETQTRLELQQTELEQINTQLEERTQDLEGQRNALARAKSSIESQARVVEQASRYKSDFLANMSHELRTPLNSSLILAKLLADNRGGNLTPEQVKYANTIQASGNDLLALINDVLDLSKIEAGHMEVRAETVAIDKLVENLKASFEPVAMQKGLSLAFNVAADTPPGVETDWQRLLQILKNLLSNALKFTEHGQVSMLITGTHDGRVSMAVSDTGIGIPQEQQQAIFDPFYQAEGGSTRRFGGTGLGLSISRQLARLLGGEIRLQSEPGQGSTFTIFLPVTMSGVVPLPSEPLAAQPVPVPMVPPSAAAKLPTPIASFPDDRDRIANSTRLILVVEDDQSFAHILFDLAHEMRFDCLVAHNAADALALAMEHVPSAIILDVGLPDNSGLVVLERLKGHARTRHIPVHVVSANDYTQTALALGAIGYMLKPVKREQLVEAFQHLEDRLTRKLRRVLVVEDDPVQLDAMKDLMGSLEVETRCAQTAAECLAELKEGTFDCMVLDLSLPDASGFSLLETLSTEHAYAFPPVIVYTGRDLSGEEEQRLRRYSKSIIIKGAKSPERLLDEVTLFLHQVVSDLPPEQQRMLEIASNRDAALEGRRILVAEDDVRNVFALTSLLEGRGVQLKIARNGREAIQALEASQSNPAEAVDLVLMDIMMPEMDGIAAMKEIRQRPEWKRLPIIALTAKAMKNDQELCLAAGANDYLAKPLDVEKLLSLIRVWMPR